MGALDEFMQGARTVTTNGNTPWAQAYALEHMDIWRRFSDSRPRSLQVHLGPSEIGAVCDRQVAGKLAGWQATNHIPDPWPSLRGTALHLLAEDVYAFDNTERGLRWMTETKVYPHPLHSGHSDLYDADAAYRCVGDHKFLGVTSMDKVKSPSGPPRKWFIQLLLYALGFQNMGFPVQRFALLAWPATAASMYGLYVWGYDLNPGVDGDHLRTVFAELEQRKAYAVELLMGTADLMDIPAVVDSEECYFCPFYRSQSATDGGPGCPGHVGKSTK